MTQKIQEVRIEILMTGTKIKACHQKWQIVMIWQFVQNGTKLENTKVLCDIGVIV